MNIYLPNSIFSSIFQFVIPQNENINIIKKEAALLTTAMLKDSSSVSLIPSLELINHNDLFISSKFSYSFDGALSYAYLYFTENERNIENIFIRADVTINEIILTKVLFAERYSINPDIIIDTSQQIHVGRDYVVSGEENFFSWNIQNGISFADEISDLINLPYVNFIFTSQDKNSIEFFNNIISDADIRIEDNIDKILKSLGYSDNVKMFVKDNLNSIYFELTDNELEALKELIKLTYYYEIIDDIFDLNFV